MSSINQLASQGLIFIGQLIYLANGVVVRLLHIFLLSQLHTEFIGFVVEFTVFLL